MKALIFSTLFVLLAISNARVITQDLWNQIGRRGYQNEPSVFVDQPKILVENVPVVATQLVNDEQVPGVYQRVPVTQGDEVRVSPNVLQRYSEEQGDRNVQGQGYYQQALGPWVQGYELEHLCFPEVFYGRHHVPLGCRRVVPQTGRYHQHGRIGQQYVQELNFPVLNQRLRHYQQLFAPQVYQFGVRGIPVGQENLYPQQVRVQSVLNQVQGGQPRVNIEGQQVPVVEVDQVPEIQRVQVNTQINQEQEIPVQLTRYNTVDAQGNQEQVPVVLQGVPETIQQVRVSSEVRQGEVQLAQAVQGIQEGGNQLQGQEQVRGVPVGVRSVYLQGHGFPVEGIQRIQEGGNQGRETVVPVGVQEVGVRSVYLQGQGLPVQGVQEGGNQIQGQEQVRGVPVGVRSVYLQGHGFPVQGIQRIQEGGNQERETVVPVGVQEVGVRSVYLQGQGLPVQGVQEGGNQLQGRETVIPVGVQEVGVRSVYLQGQGLPVKGGQEGGNQLEGIEQVRTYLQEQGLPVQGVQGIPEGVNQLQGREVGVRQVYRQGYGLPVQGVQFVGNQLPEFLQDRGVQVGVQQQGLPVQVTRVTPLGVQIQGVRVGQNQVQELDQVRGTPEGVQEVGVRSLFRQEHGLPVQGIQVGGYQLQREQVNGIPLNQEVGVRSVQQEQGFPRQTYGVNPYEVQGYQGEQGVPLVQGQGNQYEQNQRGYVPIGVQVLEQQYAQGLPENFGRNGVYYRGPYNQVYQGYGRLNGQGVWSRIPQTVGQWNRPGFGLGLVGVEA